jgi:hypothetical protein
MGLTLTRVVVTVLAWTAAVTGGPLSAPAEEGWNPFRERDERRGPLQTRPADETWRLAPVDREVLDRASPTDAPAPGRYDRPWTEAPGAPPAGGSATVERVELAPLPPLANPPAAADEPARPALPVVPGLVGRPGAPESRPTAERAAIASPAANPGFWRGLDMAALEKHLGAIEIPLKSPSQHALWLRLMTSDASPPAGVKSPSHWPTLQLEGLYRVGAMRALSERLAGGAGLLNDRLAAGFLIRRDLATNDGAAVCDRVRSLLAERASLPKILLGEVQILSGYCAALDGNVAGAGLAASLARDIETDAPLALTLLDAIALGRDGPPPKLDLPKRLLLIEYRLLEVLGPVDVRRILPLAEPALLAALARQPGADPRVALPAAEAAAAIHAVSGEDLATLYAAVVPPPNAADPVFRRAAAFQAMRAEVQPARRLVLARQALEDIRKAGGGQPLIAALAPALGSLPPDTGMDAGTVVDIAIAARDGALARRAAAAAGSGPWLALAELADPASRPLSEPAVSRLEAAALSGRFTAQGLHRLVTVLDAFDVNIPVPLWEAASRTPQPNTGHLPPTGLLSDLDQAGRRTEPAHTALLALRALGPGGAAGAHLLALGETIRALRRAGLDAEARFVAVEALLPVWPR